MAQDRVRRAGLSRFGSPGRATQGAVHVCGPSDKGGTGVANKPGVLMLDSVSDAGLIVTNYLWVDDTGDLRIATAFPVDQNADGAVVGGQS